MAKFKVNKTFRDDGGAWRLQGAVIEIALEAAKQLIMARIITPILESLLPKKVETAEKKLGAENADSKNQKQKGNS
jgi:hypothetical protein